MAAPFGATGWTRHPRASGTSVLAIKGAPMGTTGASYRVPPRRLPYAVPESLSVPSRTASRRVRTAPSFSLSPNAFWMAAAR